jgi:hypothetical protein
MRKRYTDNVCISLDRQHHLLTYFQVIPTRHKNVIVHSVRSQRHLQQFQRERGQEVRQAKRSLGLVKREAGLAISKMQIAFEQQRQAMERQMAEKEAIWQDREKQLKERSAQQDADHANEFEAWRAKLEQDEARNVSKYAPVLSLNGTNSNKRQKRNLNLQPDMQG